MFLDVLAFLPISGDLGAVAAARLDRERGPLLHRGDKARAASEIKKTPR